MKHIKYLPLKVDPLSLVGFFLLSGYINQTLKQDFCLQTIIGLLSAECCNCRLRIFEKAGNAGKISHMTGVFSA